MPATPEKNMEEHVGHILIVDDEEFIRSSFQLYFETLGYRASVAEGGEKALEILRRESPAVDIVLLDLLMPGMHGIEILRRVKEIDTAVEVIIATGCGSMSTAIQALRYGAYDYITKPIVNFDEDLRKVVEAALESRRRACRSTSPPVADKRSSATLLPDSDAVVFLLALEALACEVKVCHLVEERALAMAARIGQFFEAGAVAILHRLAEGQLACLARWEAQPCEDLWDISPEGVEAMEEEWGEGKACWRPWLPRGVNSASQGEPRVEALLLALELPGSTPQWEGARLLLLRRGGTSWRTLVPAPHLLALVARHILCCVGEPVRPVSVSAPKSGDRGELAAVGRAAPGA